MANKTLADYTEQEFIEFIEKIKKADFATESEHDEAIYEFSQLTEHPDGWDRSTVFLRFWSFSWR